ncbi:hypothetical protein OSB04_016480 [Centaurea solstitialis]|uniref:Tf2-1-like SH3-like domain-containing protein n=1 Tax=Centaurea solstitialis TaxID=347529 RepID=A0AA38T114_9ASTR|nr:hypothetical protein OSB04_016480 [Centaurea solstitialis]
MRILIDASKSTIRIGKSKVVFEIYTIFTVGSRENGSSFRATCNSGQVLCVIIERVRRRSSCGYYELAGSGNIGLKMCKDCLFGITILSAREKKVRAAISGYLKKKPMFFSEATKDYRLELPEELRGIHNTFHVSNLRKCLADASLVVPVLGMKVAGKLHYEDELEKILDRELR